jgi:phospholipid transport system substrate-binding protein
MNKSSNLIKSLIIVIIITFCPFFFSSITQTQATTVGPGETVKNFQSTLLEVMKKAKNTNVRQRYKHLASSINKTFHFPLMVQIASGKYWKQATNSEQISLIDSFQRMSIMTLATLFNGYNGEEFKVQNVKEGPQNTTLVSTELIKTDKSKISIVYVTRPFKNGWRIIDVVVDKGISELLVRRSEYKQVLKNKGITGLISLLDKKAEELSLH